MKKYFLTLTILALISVVLSSCKEDPKSEEPMHDHEFPKVTANKNLNISVLLDLSDRINPKKYPSPAMEFYLRDVGYLKSIAENFEAHMMNKRMIKIDDKIQVFIDPEPSDKTLNKKLGALKISFNRNNVTKEDILMTCKKYDSISTLIYEAAINDDHYVGSDTWRFFKNKVNDYCIEDNHRNILVVLTDGYIYHKDTKIKEGNRTTYLTPQDVKRFGFNKPGWKDKFEQQDFGFIVPNKDLSNLEVLVLGINPDDKNPYEEDIIRAYWSKWLNEMNVKNFEIKQADLPSNMEKVIQGFILKE
ncbi:hypothetical protein Q4603_02225 [Zobellia galactanivorans]|uniref:hypothetical protein n=1 Tax=Zobellia galactanivorans (strain DSM 12802 / CCUG 47099 / CIP 106680 / NCIMB 13871 / Dsij) TaxID=63186 RepID=UPI0026E2BECA|nr:hypothetical protein [Zobellia galactanivorans]MDO6807401.1 hypothetical protein [Zobellia galactanivorans]